MKEELDLTRSKRPRMVPEQGDLNKLHIEIDKIERLIHDTGVMEKLYDGLDHTKLVLLRKQRIYDIIKTSLTRELTSDENNIAWHNEVRGRIRESFDILEELEGVRTYKSELEGKRKGLMATVERWGKRVLGKTKE